MDGRELSDTDLAAVAGGKVRPVSIPDPGGVPTGRVTVGGIGDPFRASGGGSAEYLRQSAAGYGLSAGRWW